MWVHPDARLRGDAQTHERERTREKEDKERRKKKSKEWEKPKYRGGSMKEKHGARVGDRCEKGVAKREKGGV